MPRKTAGSGRTATQPRCFNEAAARCRGKRPLLRPPPSQGSRFNEAAARCRGKPGLHRALPAAAALASMRPRPDAAENAFGPTTMQPALPPASMRPRPDAAENQQRTKDKPIVLELQ